MKGYIIEATFKFENKIVSAPLEFKNLKKIKYNQLDVIIHCIYGFFSHYDLDLINCNIYYKNDCGHKDLVLSFNSEMALECVFNGIDYLHQADESTDAYHLEMRNIRYKEFSKILKKYKLYDGFRVDFKINK